MLLMRKKASMFPNNWLTKKRKKAVIYQVYLNYEFEKFTDSYKHKKVSKYIKVNKNIYKIAISVFILINTMSVFSDFIMYYKRTLTLISTKVHQNQETLLLMCVDLTEKQSLYGDSSFSTLQTVCGPVSNYVSSHTDRARLCEKSFRSVLSPNGILISLQKRKRFIFLSSGWPHLNIAKRKN